MPAGKQDGWLRASFFKFDVSLIDLKSGVEATNAIPVTITVTDMDGNAFDSAVLECQLLDANGLSADVADWTMAETGDGSEISATAQPRLLILTSAAGLATVTVTDVSGTYTGDVYLLVRPLEAVGAAGLESLTFA